MTSIKNLGQVKAIHRGTTSPSNTSMIWYNTSNGFHYYYDGASSQWKALKFSPDDPIESLQFLTTVDPTQPLAEGRIRWNKHSLTFEFGANGSIIQINQEGNFPVINKTGVAALDGKLFRIVGYDAATDQYTIALSDCSSNETALVDGMMTQDILNNEVGIIVYKGIVRGLDTSAATTLAPAYLGQNGEVTHIVPEYPCVVKQVGKFGRIHATEGEIIMDVSSTLQLKFNEIDTELGLKQQQNEGICEKMPVLTDDIVVDAVARTLTIVSTRGGSPITPAEPLIVYVDGDGIIEKFEYPAPVVFTWGETVGTWYFYIDREGNPIASQQVWTNFSILAPIFVLVVNTAGDIVEEQIEFHTNSIGAEDHEWKHTYGTIHVRGFELINNKLETGAPNADGRNTVVSVTSGRNIDDNLPYDIENTTDVGYFKQDMGHETSATLTSLNAGFFKIRSIDVNGDLEFLPATRYPFAWDGATDQPQFIQPDGTKVLVPEDHFFVYYLYALQDRVPGQGVRLASAETTFPSITDARAHTWDTLKSHCLDLRNNEIRPLYKLIFLKNQNPPAQFTVDCKYSALRDYEDYRRTRVTVTSAVSGSIQASNVLSPALPRLTGTNAQAKFQQIDAEVVRNLGVSSENEIVLYSDDTGKETKTSGIVIGQTQQGQFRPISQSGLDVVFSGGQVRKGIEIFDIGSKLILLTDDSVNYVEIGMEGALADIYQNTEGFGVTNIPLWEIGVVEGAITYFADKRSPYLAITDMETSLTNTIIVDAARGDDTTADGSIAKPYKTPEQAVADFDPVVYEFAGDTLVNENNITVAAGITENLKIGQLIIGAGIPFNTRITSLAQYAITMSNNATATATDVSFEIWKEARIESYGDFVITSNLDKDGIVEYDFKGAVAWGSFSLFNMNYKRKTELTMRAKTWQGTHANSVLVFNSESQAAWVNGLSSKNLWVKCYGDVQSKGTGYVFNLHNLNNVWRECNLLYEGNVDTVGGFLNTQNGYCNITAYITATLGHIRTHRSEIIQNGSVVLPTTINMFTSTNSGSNWVFSGDLFGSLTDSGNMSSMFITGTLAGTLIEPKTIFFDFTGTFGPSVVSFTTGIVHCKIRKSSPHWNHLSTITNNGSQLTINIGSLTNYGITFRQYSGRTSLNVEGLLHNIIMTDGQLITNGNIYSTTHRGSFMDISGGFWINNANVDVAFDPQNDSKVLIQSGGLVKNKGELKGNSVRKSWRFSDMSGGIFESRNGHISTANGMPPIRCIGAAQDIRWFNGTTNSDTVNSIEKGYGKVIYIRVTTAETDTQFDLTDGATTETFSVVGAGLTREQIAQQFVTDILASTLNFEYVEIGGSAQGLTDYDIQIVGLEEQAILASTLTNATTVVRVDFGFKPNFVHKVNLIEDPNLE